MMGNVLFYFEIESDNNYLSHSKNNYKRNRGNGLAMVSRCHCHCPFKIINVIIFVLNLMNLELCKIIWCACFFLCLCTRLRLLAENLFQ